MASVWIDLANSPHVLFFAPIIRDLTAAGHRVLLSARDFAQTVPLCETFGLDCVVVGGHGGKNRARKVLNTAGRAAQLAFFARKQRIDVAVSHNSYAQVIAARALGIPSLTLMDYEYQPANHISFRLADRIMVPEIFHEHALRFYGAKPKKTLRYRGLKEEVYLDGYQPPDDARERVAGLFRELSHRFSIDEDVLVIVRPPATMAAYHHFENPLFARLMERLDAPDVFGVLLPRTAAQRRELRVHLPERFVIPEHAPDGRALIAASDMVISAGGTMIREAAVLGVPAYSLYWGRLGGVDEHLVACGQLMKLESTEDLESLCVKRRRAELARVSSPLRAHVIAQLLVLAESKKQ